MQIRAEERVEGQVLGAQHASDDVAVVFAQVQDADVRAHLCHLLDDVASSGFAQCHLIRFCALGSQLLSQSL